jgi:hypothetical protein
VPGALPADTDPKARAVWERTTRARLSAQDPGTPQRVTAFDLEIEVRHRSADNQTNDSPKPWRYRFQSPGFVRVTTANRRELVRGPAGDFLIDPDRHEVIRLDVSRENAEDLRQLDESVGIAQNFIALTDPSALRIARLRLLAEPPPGLPPAVRKRATDLQLQWLELETPDFHLSAGPERSNAPPGSNPQQGSSSSAPKLVRVLIGADPKSGEVEIAWVDTGSSPSLLSASAVLIELTRYAPVDGFRMPQQIKVYEVDDPKAPRAFRWEPTTMLGVHTASASLRAAFKPEDFTPH